MPILFLSLLSAASALLCIRSKYSGSALQLYVFKPLTTVLILVIGLISVSDSASAYGYFVIAGIFFSLWGDVFLMLPKDRFIAGLSSFLVAHILFIMAFATSSGPMPTGWIAIPVFLIAAAASLFLLPHAGKLKPAVLTYIIVISVMLWQSWERWHILKTADAMIAGLGASFFMVSDFMLAYQRFIRPFKHAHAAVLGTYYTAIWLFALSTGP
ncbi:MAG: lysoplasmalogenase [Desulfobacterales bacterium]